MKAEQFLSKAKKLMEERGKTYDSAEGERSASKTADAFNAITGHSLSESDVWLMLLLLKQVRQWSKEEYHADSAEDSVSYAALLAESLASEEDDSKQRENLVRDSSKFDSNEGSTF